MKLVNYADGVRDHYCIGREVKDGHYWEYYNKGKWCSAGQVFIGRAVAESKIKQLQVKQP